MSLDFSFGLRQKKGGNLVLHADVPHVKIGYAAACNFEM